MKYLFINVTAGFGSTGRIALEQCRELMAQGHTCAIAYGRGKRPEGVMSVPIGGRWNTRLHALRSRVLDDVGFGSYGATLRFLHWVKAYDPDVIWLHNIHGYYIHIGLLFDYLRDARKQVRWTLHDCWAFTGHCPYFEDAGCDRWKNGCHHCPQKGSYPKSVLRDNSRRNFEKKKALFTSLENMTLVVPSHWLEERVKESFLGKYPVEVCYNRVDRNVFHPTASDFRSRHGLEGKTVLLGVASVWEERKGLKDFVALSRMLDDSYKIVLIGLTAKQIRALPKEILGLPRTGSAQELAQAYSAADLFLNPSREETFGMTTLEAACCGTQAVVYQGTACEEIAGRFGGLAVPKGAQGLYQAVLALKRKEIP